MKCQVSLPKAFIVGECGKSLEGSESKSLIYVDSRTRKVYNEGLQRIGLNYYKRGKKLHFTNAFDGSDLMPEDLRQAIKEAT